MSMSSPSDLLTDARGRRFAPHAAPPRVVSLVPSITELLFDLGLTSREVVGRTKFCVHPAGVVREVPDMGGTKTVHADRVREAAPDLLIANIDENPRELVEALDKWKPQPWIYVTHPTNVEDALVMIRDLGRLLGREEAAARILAEIADAREALAVLPRESAVYLIWRRPYMTVAPDTFIHAMLREAGFAHVIDETWLDARHLEDGARRYPEISLADIAALRPAHILLSSEPFPFGREHVAELRAGLHPFDAAYAEEVSIRIVDGEHYSWYGSRMRAAFRSFADRT
jgi:ABC-type Fe3+-hydroxamate transport system substrate-binding protein